MKSIVYDHEGLKKFEFEDVELFLVDTKSDIFESKSGYQADKKIYYKLMPGEQIEILY